MKKIRKVTDLEFLIENGIEESLTLEYKSSDALSSSGNKIKELIKDVTAMANSAGGTIIYGIKEFDDKERNHLPEKITPISRIEFSKERIEDILTSNISPKLEGVIIHPIQLDNPDEVVYVIEIPQSTTAHQNLKDFRYYKRFNFKAEPMADYEVRDVMNRQKNPLITLDLKIEYRTTILEGPQKSFAFPRPIPEEDQGELEVFLLITPINKGGVLAKFTKYVLDIPGHILSDDAKFNIEFDNNGIGRYTLFNKAQDIISYSTNIQSGRPEPIWGPSRFEPILPGSNGITKEIRLLDPPQLNGDHFIDWFVHADNAPVQNHVASLSEIEITTRTVYRKKT